MHCHSLSVNLMVNICEYYRLQTNRPFHLKCVPPMDPNTGKCQFKIIIMLPIWHFTSSLVVMRPLRSTDHAGI